MPKLSKNGDGEFDTTSDVSNEGSIDSSSPKEAVNTSEPSNPKPESKDNEHNSSFNRTYRPLRRGRRKSIPINLEGMINTKGAVPSDTADVSFMHPSEREFAKLLDYYEIPYLYEPRSFPLRWEGNRVERLYSPFRQIWLRPYG